MSVIISIVNQKGGVGKTTTTVNLSSALASLGQNVLVVDLDPQAHSTEHWGLGGKSNIGIAEVLHGSSEIRGAIAKTYKPGVSILTSHLRLGQYNQNHPEGNQFQLKHFLDQIRDDYDYILIDCQPSLSLLTLNALTASDKVLLPVQSEYLALDGLTQLILTFREVKSKLHPSLSILGVVLTMYDKRNRLSAEIQKELEKNFGSDLFETVIPRSVRFAEAPSFGQSIMEYSPGTEASYSYTKLALELMRKLELLEAREQEKSDQEQHYQNLNSAS